MRGRNAESQAEAGLILSDRQLVAALRPDSQIVATLRAVAAGLPVRGAREAVAAARTLLEWSTPKPAARVAVAVACSVADPYDVARAIEVVAEPVLAPVVSAELEE